MNWGTFCNGVIATILFSLPAVAQDQQIGARTKAMGGSYTAFEDDPVSIWLNPAGIATQQDQFALNYQTYTAYQVERSSGENNTVIFNNDTKSIMSDPAIIPAFLGAVFQAGDPDAPLAVGICYARPYQINYALDEIFDANETNFDPDSSIQQSLARFRIAVALDFPFREAGEAGFFQHLAFGIGLDVGIMNWRFDGPNSNEYDTSTGYGFGAGLLTTLYDNMESFKINFGIAYQSSVLFDFSIEPDLLPAFDMPQQFNAGVTFYLLEGTPLRLTIDFQWIDWSATAERPSFLTELPRFEDAINYSVGAEYRVEYSEKITFFPRVGIRIVTPPWDDHENLPVTGWYKLVLDTDAERFTIFSFGTGISWSTEEGKIRTVDIAGDVGGDSFTAAIGYTHEF